LGELNEAFSFLGKRSKRREEKLLLSDSVVESIGTADHKVFYFCNILSSMPRQSVSAENNPGEKAMMRKFAIAVFALSLTALGCGSDSGTTTPDAQADGVATPPAAEAGAGRDVATASEVATPVVDAFVADVAVPSDLAVPDVALPLDVAQPTDVAQVIEAGNKDAAPALDGGTAGAVDAGKDAAPALDGGTAGAVDAGAGEAGLAADAGTTG
jgi:hypothetical protein